MAGNLDARLKALAHFESHDRDLARGRKGEVSRYQILPSIWRHYAPISFRSNPTVARRIAITIAQHRIGIFQSQTRRSPNHTEFYLLWNAPGLFEQADWIPALVKKRVLDRAKRYAALLK